ncbi:MAG: hypothetical protein NPIRA02_09380 [Nitrospirales bacterium]|nr:MAG: hypothetical protein NPIRA02_09380 [Nitrospirales bacterium]
MDMPLTLTPTAVNLLLVVGLGLIALSVLYLRYLGTVERTQRAFQALQPDVHITKSTTIYSNREDILKVYLQNFGGSQASDIRVTVHGAEGVEPLPVIPVMAVGSQEHEVWIKANPTSPLLQEKRDSIRLSIYYRDQWGHSYTLTYPVVQRDTLRSLVTLQLVDGGTPRTVRPIVSYWRMRRCINRHAQKMAKKTVRRLKQEGAGASPTQAQPPILSPWARKQEVS